MAIELDVPDVEEFDRDDLELSPRTHWELAKMAAERGEEYDPLEFERRLDEVPDPDPIEDAVPVDPDE